VPGEPCTTHQDVGWDSVCLSLADESGEPGGHARRQSTEGHGGLYHASASAVSAEPRLRNMQGVATQSQSTRNVWPRTRCIHAVLNEVTCLIALAGAATAGPSQGTLQQHRTAMTTHKHHTDLHCKRKWNGCDNADSAACAITDATPCHGAVTTKKINTTFHAYLVDSICCAGDDRGGPNHSHDGGSAVECPYGAPLNSAALVLAMRHLHVKQSCLSALWVETAAEKYVLQDPSTLGVTVLVSRHR